MLQSHRRGASSSALLVILGGILMTGIAAGLIVLMVLSEDTRADRADEREPKPVSIDDDPTPMRDEASGPAPPAPVQPDDGTQAGDTRSPRQTVPVTMEPTIVNFGIVGPNEDLTGEVTLHNPTDSDVTIMKISPSCACTVVSDIEGEVIPAGSSIVMSLAMNSENRMGPKKSQVHVLFKEFPGGVLTAQLDAMVRQPVYAIPASITAIDTQEGVVTIRSMDEQPFRILAVNGAAPSFVDHDPATDQPSNEYRLNWSTRDINPETCLLPDGTKPRPWLIVLTDHPACRVFDIQVRHDCTRPHLPSDGRKWYFTTRRGPLGALQPGEKTIIDVEMKWLPNVEPFEDIYAVTTSSAVIEAEIIEYKSLAKEQILRIEMTLTDAHKGGEIWETLYLHSQHFNAELPVFGFALTGADEG